MNGQPISTRMAWLSPFMSSTGLWNGSRMSLVAVVAFDAKPHAVPVETQRADVPASQRRRQPGHQPRDHVVVGGVQVPEQARFDLAERVGPGGEQVRDADGFGAGGVGHHDGCDLQPQQGTGSRPWAGGPDLGVSRPAAAPGAGTRWRSGRAVADTVGRRDPVQAAADPHQRTDRLAQRQRRVIGQLQQRLRSVRPAPAGARWRGTRTREGSVVQQVMHRRRSPGLRASSTASSAPPARTQALRMRSAVVGAALVSGNIVTSFGP